MKPHRILGTSNGGWPIHQCDGPKCNQVAITTRTVYTSKDWETKRIVTIWLCADCAAEWDETAEPGATCSACGAVVPESEIIQIQDHSVCIDCYHVEKCVICGREIIEGTECAFCLRGEFEAAQYAADYRDWENGVLEASR
jgi:DNA-directed RNA polymerase subunit RPC12/RpoP